MKSAIIKFLGVLCVLCGASFLSFALDREAFTITKYDLDVRLEPEQQRLGARGKITLRNDSAQPQKIVALQISSSLNWRAIRVDGKAVQFVSQPYTSDIDHTGSLSEAIVTLPSDNQSERIGGSGDWLRRLDPAGFDTAGAGRRAGGDCQARKLGSHWHVVHGGAGRGVCGVVSDYDRVGGFLRGQQFV